MAGIGQGGVLGHNHPGKVNPGKSLSNLNQVPGSAIGTVERIVSALPQPKRPGTTAKAAPKKDGEGGSGPLGDKKLSTLASLQPI